MVRSEKPTGEGNHVKKISGHATFKGEMVGQDLEQKKEDIRSRKEIEKENEATGDCYCM